MDFSVLGHLDNTGERQGDTIDVEHAAAMATAYVVYVQSSLWAEKWKEMFVHNVSITCKHAYTVTLPPYRTDAYIDTRPWNFTGITSPTQMAVAQQRCFWSVNSKT